MSIEFAWAAGFFDGEGYVSISASMRASRTNNRVYSRHTMYIGVNHVRVEPLLEMQRIFGGQIYSQNPNTVVGNRKPRYTWHLSTKQAADALYQMLPYFRNKIEAAQIALEFYSLTTDQRYKRAGTPEPIRLQREELRQKLIALNAES